MSSSGLHTPSTSSLAAGVAEGGLLVAAPGRKVLRRAPGYAEVNPARHARRRFALERGLGIGVPIALIVLWQLASERSWINPLLYPSPSAVFVEAGDLWERGLLWESVWVSTKRMLIGYGYGAGAGIAIGLAMGMWRAIRASLETLLNALYTVPKLALLPVFVTALGFGDGPIIAIIAVTVFFFVWISTTSAVLAVSTGYREAALSINANRWHMFRHVLLPASAPQIFVGLRIGAGVSVLVLVGVELVIAQSGLGYLIQQGRSLLLLDQTYVGIMLSALLGLAFTYLVRVIGRIVVPWAREDNTIDVL